MDESLAYRDGFADGLDWDLDGYADRAAVKNDPSGWSDATISAVGTSACRAAWGVPEEASWSAALADYDRGALAGALAPQADRTGKPPADVCGCDACAYRRSEE